MDIIGYEGLYKIYDDGRVFSVRRNIFVKPQNTNEYYYINLHNIYNGGRKHITIHSLVALHFIGERPIGYDIDHIDKNPLNNHVSNLRYISKSENQANKYVVGKIPYRHICKYKECGFQIKIIENFKVIFYKSSIKWSLDDAIRVRNEAYIKLGIEIDDVIRK